MIQTHALPKERTIMPRKSTIKNYDVFKPPYTEEASYWLGFLMADGSMTSYKSKVCGYTQNKLSIGLSIKDLSHLEKLKKYLNTTNKISVYNASIKKLNKTYPSCRISFTHPILTKDLMNLGIIPNKTYKTHAPDSMKTSKHFWRGMVDGDGCLDTKLAVNVVRPRIQLSGTEEILIQYVEFINSNIIGVAHKSLYKQTKSKSYIAVYSDFAAIKIIKLLYEGANIYLDRKFELANTLINTFEENNHHKTRNLLWR